jgi:hypothetical protein
VDRRRLQAAGSDYPYLRGLLAVPGGALFAVAALGNWEWGPLRHDWVFVAVLVVIALVFFLINRHYNEHYGRVTPSTRQQLKAAAAVAVGLGLMIGAAMLLRSRASWSLDLPVNAIAAAFGLLMLVYYAAVVGLRPHHVLIWGALLAAGLLPLWDGADPSNIGLVLAGVAVVVNGVLDHRLLVRILGPSTTPEHAGG